MLFRSGFAGTMVILLAIMTLLIMFITERLFFASLGKKSAVKFSEMKARHQEIKKAKQEAYYSEEYEEDEYEEREYNADNGKQQSEKNYDKSEEISYEEKKKPERKKKAKTFTFPHTNVEDKSPLEEASVSDSIVNEATVPMAEVKPFDFDAIPIHRGKTNYDRYSKSNKT